MSARSLQPLSKPIRHLTDQEKGTGSDQQVSAVEVVEMALEMLDFLGRYFRLRLLSFSEKEKGYPPTPGATFGKMSTLS